VPFDHSAAEHFIWSAARLVDRHRYPFLIAEGTADAIVEAPRTRLRGPPALAVDGPRAGIDSLATRIDPSAFTPTGGVDGETLRPLDISARPGTRSRRLFSDEQVEAHLDAVEAEQRQDGGWMFDSLPWSPAETNDGRGTVTIRALTWLRDNERL